MGECEMIQNLPCARSVDTTENDITIERGAVSLLLHRAVGNFFDDNVFCCRHRPHAPSCHVDLEFSYIPACGRLQPVKIVDLNLVEINEGKKLKTHPRQSLGDQGPHAA